MKRLLAAALAATLLFSLAACGERRPIAREESSSQSQAETGESGGEEAAAGTISIDGVDFYPIEISQELLDTLATGEGTLPGERSETVSSVKSLLAQGETEELEFVSHSQSRPEVLDYFDDHLETLVGTLYDFCQLEQEPVLDELTVYLLEALPTLPEEMQRDVYTVYKSRMIEAGIDGSLLRTGESLGLYYMAQTDPDWADYPFPNPDSPNEVNDTAIDRSCGVMSMTMVASTYLHREVDPTYLIDYVLDNGYRITASGVDDTFMPVAAELFGMDEPSLYYQSPADGQETIDWEYIRQYIDENNAMAIVHETHGSANFTPAQHYMVIADYVEIDGTGYFLMEDPYQSRSRYWQWGTSAMGDPGLGEEGVIYATPALVAESASAVILFPGDQDAWEVTCASSQPASLT